MFLYKKDIVEELVNCGYSTYKIRKEKMFSQSTLTAFRNNVMVNWETLDKVCTLLNCQIGDLIEHRPDNTIESDK